MKLRKLLKEIKGVFKPPIKTYYIGKLKHGSPYFYPLYFNPTILSTRKLKLKSEEELQKHIEKYPHLEQHYRSNNFKFSNLPMVRRSRDWIVKIFNEYYWIEIGLPITWVTVELGWKDKFNSPRYEWSPSFQLYLFNWQFCIFWNAPDNNDDGYYEMVVWYLNYCNKDIKKAEETWGWIDYNTKESTWNKDYLL